MKLTDVFELSVTLRFTSFAKACAVVDPEDPELQVGIFSLPPEEQAAFQSRVVFKGILNLLRAEGNVEHVLRYVNEALLMVDIKDPTLHGADCDSFSCWGCGSHFSGAEFSHTG